MSELTESIEKSVTFLRRRYPDGISLLNCLESQLVQLKAKKEKTFKEVTSIEGQNN